MARHSTKWILAEHKDGTWELLRGNRSHYAGMASYQEALLRFVQSYRPGETIVHEEPDGYRTNITEQLRKRGLIS